MKKAVLLFAAAAAALAQQDFDFKVLDKLGANATSSTNVTLDANMLKLAGNFLDSGDTDLKSVVKNLKGVYVRSYEFDKAGQYKESDLAPVRDYIRKLQWPKIVDVKEADETTEIYLQPLPNDQLGGLAIVSAEPKEVTVVFISGALKISDIGKLGGNLGIPNITLDHRGKGPDKSKKD